MTSQFVSCPDCHVLVLDTTEERREHRAADRQDRQVIEALRRAVRGATDDSTKALQLVRDLQHDLEQIDGRVRTAEDAPEPELVVVGEWPADELDEPAQESQYADEDTDIEPTDDEPEIEPDDDFEDDDDQPAVTPSSSDPLRYFHPTTT